MTKRDSKDLFEKDLKVEEFFEEDQYVCKDLEVISIQEPCLMCSMALNHARIEKLFYSIGHIDGWGGCNV